MDPNNPQNINTNFDPSTFELNQQTRQFSPINQTPPFGGYVNFLNQGMPNSSSPIPQTRLFGSPTPNMFPQGQYPNDQFAQFQRWQQQQQLQNEFDKLQQQQQQQQEQQQEQPPPQQEQPRRHKRTKAASKRRGKQSLQQQSLQQQSLIDEDDDVEVVPETQRQQSPPPPPQAPPKKSHLWTEDEEETLMKAWIGVSTDAAKGTDQTGMAFFKRVAERFGALIGNPNHRSYDALNSKWRELKKEVTDFQGAFNKVMNQNASGSNQLDAYRAAGNIYKARNNQKEFCHYKAWKLAREHGIRWGDQQTSEMLADSTDSNKRPRTSESEHSFNLDLNDDAAENTAEEPEFEQELPRATTRPMGRNKAKQAGKGVASGSGEDPLVGTWKEQLEFAKERAERKRVDRERFLEEQRRLWDSQQRMLNNQQALFEQQKRMFEQHEQMVQQQNATLADQQLLANVEVLGKVPDPDLDEESRAEIEAIKREIRLRRMARRGGGH